MAMIDGKFEYRPPTGVEEAAKVMDSGRPSVLFEWLNAPPPIAIVRSPHQNVMIDLPDDPKERKGIPLCTGLLDYFPAALAEVAKVSKAGNDQHNPGQPIHWARGKSSDHPDCIARHLSQRGTRDNDGQRHSAKMVWRSLALLQEELEAEAGFKPEGT